MKISYKLRLMELCNTTQITSAVQTTTFNEVQFYRYVYVIIIDSTDRYVNELSDRLYQVHTQIESHRFRI